MATLRTCQGCIAQGQPCEAREKFLSSIKGYGITSVKWKCKERVPRYKAGDPVWALTVAGHSEGYFDHGEPLRDEFPATVIRMVGAKAIVFIKPGTEGKGHCGDGVPFETTGRGFCKIPLSRLTVRDGQLEAICKFCEQPETMGHQEGFSCAISSSIAVA